MSFTPVSSTSTPFQPWRIPEPSSNLAGIQEEPMLEELTGKPSEDKFTPAIVPDKTSVDIKNAKALSLKLAAQKTVATGIGAAVLTTLATSANAAATTATTPETVVGWVVGGLALMLGAAGFGLLFAQASYEKKYGLD